MYGLRYRAPRKLSPCVYGKHDRGFRLHGSSATLQKWVPVLISPSPVRVPKRLSATANAQLFAAQ